MTKKLAAVHPGELRREDFLEPMDLSAGALARVVGVPRTRIERLINGQTAQTADTALRPARAFGTTAAFWLGLRAQSGLECAEDELRGGLKKITPVAGNAAA